MGDTFNKVTNLSAQSMLQEICQMIKDNEFLIVREKVYKNVKYIVVAQTESVNSDLDQGWKGTIGSLKSSF